MTLRVFVSSKMQELARERQIVKAALDELKIDGWVFEADAGARPQTIEQTYREEIEAADLYIGLFWKGYGDHTIEEYEYARELGKDCLIYEKRAGIEFERDAKLQALLDRIGEAQTGLTIRQYHTPEELQEFVKQDVARWQADIVRRYKVAGAPLAYRNPLPTEEKNRKELLILLNKVKRFWIDGILEQSVHHEALLQLGKKNISEAVEHPWESVLELPYNSDLSIPTDKRIIDIFEEVGRFLLILGEPGSGKTTTLLELARDLIIKAAKDPNEAIPAVFNLSSWANKGQPLTSWLVEELKAKYQVPKKIGQSWVEQHRLLPLLDGLDEVSADKQSFCVNAINTFVQEYPSGVVVCSRLREYTDLPARLKLNGAICLQPLSPAQVEEYLIKTGSELAALREALREDKNLQDLIKTPLMLSIMSLAYQNQPVETVTGAHLATIDSRRRHVFDTYIERMFARRGKHNQPYASEKLKTWLHWLAQKMQSRSESIFLIEGLQPGWLSTRWQRLSHVFVSRLIAGLCLGIGVGVAAWLIIVINGGAFEDALIGLLYLSTAGLFLGLTTGLIDAIRFKLNSSANVAELSLLLNDELHDEENNGIGTTVFLRILVSAAMHIILWWLLFTLLYARSAVSFSSILATSLIFGSIVGVIHWFIFGSPSITQGLNNDIVTVEKLSWSGSNALKWFFVGACFTAIVVLPIWFKLVQDRNYTIIETSIRQLALSRAELMQIEEKMETNFDPQRQIALERRRVWVISEMQHHEDEIFRRASTRYSFYFWALKHPGMRVVSLIYLASGGLFGLLIGGLTRGVIGSKTSPNQGIKLTFRNALLLGIILGPAIGIIGGLLIGLAPVYAFAEIAVNLSDMAVTAVAVSMIAGLLIGFRFGGFVIIKHYTLRAILYRKGYTPRNLVSVLDYFTTLVFLQKVGGGYIFIHRLLLEHFAAMNRKEDA